MGIKVPVISFLIFYSTKVVIKYLRVVRARKNEKTISKLTVSFF